ncbi:TPA: acyltransferase [Klebsiella oxytoca]|nr:acyltransferase [Klebsiella oxytoca]
MRNNVWDICRGIPVIAVVLIHASGFLSHYDTGTYQNTLGVAFRQFINFAVPVFLFISGYFSFNNKNQSSYEIIKSRIMRVAPPYIICSMIYIFVDFITKGKIPTGMELFLDFALGKAMVVGYFVIVIIQFILLTPIIKSIKNKRAHILIMASMTTFGLAYTYASKLWFSESWAASFPFSAALFFVWYPFFHFGFYLSKYTARVSIGIATIPVILAICLVESFILNDILGYEFATSQIKASSFALSFAICLLIYKVKDKKIKCMPLSFLGINSFSIYLLHMLFLPRATTLAYKLNLIDRFPFISILFIAAITMVLSVVATLSIKKVLPSKSSSLIIG